MVDGLRQAQGWLSPAKDSRLHFLRLHFVCLPFRHVFLNDEIVAILVVLSPCWLARLAHQGLCVECALVHTGPVRFARIARAADLRVCASLHEAVHPCATLHPNALGPWHHPCCVWGHRFPQECPLRLGDVAPWLNLTCWGAPPRPCRAPGTLSRTLCWGAGLGDVVALVQGPLNVSDAKLLRRGHVAAGCGRGHVAALRSDRWCSGRPCRVWPRGSCGGLGGGPPPAGWRWHRPASP